MISDRCFADGVAFPSLGWLRAEHAAGRLAALGEITAQYTGLSPDDPAFEPCWTLAEELDIPIAIHLGFTKPRAPYADCDMQRCPRTTACGSEPPATRARLIRHPRLRVLVMHAGWPFTDNMVAIMWLHPQVYVDTACPKKLPRAEQYRHLQRLVDSGPVTISNSTTPSE